MHELEKFHLKFCKRILGVHSKSTNVAIYAELGRLPLIGCRVSCREHMLQSAVRKIQIILQ